MLTSLTIFTGTYCVANQLILKYNSKLVYNYNMVRPLKGGVKYVNIFRGVPNDKYDIFWIDNNKYVYYTSNLPQIFDSVDKCKDYCIENKLQFNKDTTIGIECNINHKTDSRFDKVWLMHLCQDKREYTIITKTTEKDFKDALVRKHQLPLAKCMLVICIMLCLYFIVYYSPNKKNPVNRVWDPYDECDYPFYQK